MRYPSISPDGTKIAFASDHSGNFDIYLMSAEGRTPKRLTTNSTKEILTSFTTDGKSAIFTAVLADSYKNPMYSKGCLTEPYSVSAVQFRNSRHQQRTLTTIKK